MTPTDYKFAKMIEEALGRNPQLVYFRDKDNNYSEKIITLRQIANATTSTDVTQHTYLYDEVLEEPLSELDITQLAGTKAIKEENFESAKEIRKAILDIASKQNPGISKAVLQQKFSNYLIPFRYREICAYFNLECSMYLTFREVFSNSNNLEKVRTKVKQLLQQKAGLEKQKIATEIENLKKELDEETYESAVSHTASIYEWLNNLSAEIKLEEKKTVEEILDNWPVVFEPAPWKQTQGMYSLI